METKVEITRASKEKVFRASSLNGNYAWYICVNGRDEEELPYSMRVANWICYSKRDYDDKGTVEWVNPHLPLPCGLQFPADYCQWPTHQSERFITWKQAEAFIRERIGA